jgi:hypothetical protein
MTRLSREEVDGWVEVYYTYWKACEHLLAVHEGSSNVSPSIMIPGVSDQESLTTLEVVLDKSL